MPDRTVRTIALIGGTSQLGPALAMRWALAGHKVLIGSRQAEKAQHVAQELNDRLGVSSIEGFENRQAARRGDLAVLTVNYTAHQAALESVKGELGGKILIDTTARVDFRNPAPPPPPAAARMAQDLLGSEVRVVAAFQTVSAHALAVDPEQPLESDVLVCADDAAAAEEVVPLIRSAGLRAFLAGGLDNALVAEGAVALLIAINRRYKSKTGTLRVAGVPA